MEPKEPKTPKITVFGYPLKDWILIVAIVGGAGGGFYTLGGSPKQTTNAITDLNKSISSEMSSLRDAMEVNTRLTTRNTLRIDKLEDLNDHWNRRLDSVVDTVLIVGKNLEGYLKGRMDQFTADPDGQP